ncbi:MAG: thioredoxin [Chloroflexi bacterium]|nr:thioredoxin [Chloroflexota bacterium]
MADESIIIKCKECGTPNRVSTGRLSDKPVCGRCKAELPPVLSSPVNVTDRTFEDEVMNSPVLVLVDFWAPWCGPCRMMGPILDGLAKELSGRLKICKLNTEENRVIPSRFKINAIPAMLLFKGGVLLEQIVGAHPREALLNKIQKFI